MVKQKLSRVGKEELFLEAYRQGLIKVDFDNGVILSPYGRPIGLSRKPGLYGSVSVKVNGVKVALSPHRAVYLCHLGRPLEDGVVVSYKDGNNNNFKLSNLEPRNDLEFRREVGRKPKTLRDHLGLLEKTIEEVRQQSLNRTELSSQVPFVETGSVPSNRTFEVAALKKLREFFASKGGEVSVTAISEAFALSYETVYKAIGGLTYKDVVTPYDSECRRILKDIANRKIRPKVKHLEWGSARDPSVFE